MQPRNQLINIIVVGDASTGKNALVRQLKNSQFSEEYIPTIGAEFSNIHLDSKNEQPFTLQIWNTAGEAKYQSHIKMYNTNTNVFMICFDVTNKASFDKVEEYINNKLLESSSKKNSELKLLLVATKTDLDKAQWQVSEEDIKALTTKLSSSVKACDYVLTSAKTGENVVKAFIKSAEMFLNKSLLSPKFMTKNPEKITKPTNEQPSEENLKKNLIEALEAYRERVQNDHDVTNDYTAGFRGPQFFKKFRANNREANYKLADKLINQLNSNVSISEVFNSKNITEQRGGGTVRSDDLKYIIKQAQNNQLVELDRLKKTKLPPPKL